LDNEEDKTSDNNLPESIVEESVTPEFNVDSENADVSNDINTITAESSTSPLPESSQEVQNTMQENPENVVPNSESIPVAPVYPVYTEQVVNNPVSQQVNNQPYSPELIANAPLPSDVVGVSAGPATTVNNKLIFIILGSIVGLIFLVAIGFFGYNYYNSSSNERILGAAAKNIINSKNMEVDFTVGVDSFSLTGKLYVDNSQNLKFLVSASGYSVEALYLKAKDSVYLKELDFFDSGSTGNGKVAYYEGKNVDKAIKKYGAEDLGLDSLNPTKDYFSAKNMKLFKRESDEKRDGIDLYKFSFVANDADIKKATDQANKKIAEYSSDIQVKQVKNTTTLLIKKSDFNLYRVDGNTELNYSQKVPDYSKCQSMAYDEQISCEDKSPKKEEIQKYVFKWSLDIKGGYKDTIALAKNSTISQSIDLSTYEEDMKKSSNDSERKMNSSSVQTALETYYADNQVYPVSLALLVPKYLNSIPKNPGDTKFVYTLDNNSYKLSVKLESPDKNDTNVKNGLYTVSSSAYDSNSNAVIGPTYE